MNNELPGFINRYKSWRKRNPVLGWTTRIILSPIIAIVMFVIVVIVVIIAAVIQIFHGKEYGYVFGDIMTDLHKTLTDDKY